MAAFGAIVFFLIFITAFKNEIPVGALLLVSDQPMIPDGVKTEASDTAVTKNFVD